MAIIYWKVLSTGLIGKGSYLDSEIANAWVNKLSLDNKIEYWIEY